MKRLWIATALLVAACSTSNDPPAGKVGTTKLADPSDVIDEELMIALAQAKNFHHKAKVYTADGKPDDAMTAVRQILSIKFPAGTPEAEDIRLDARALLAKLHIGRKELDEAMRLVDEGLATTTRESFFVANLHTVKGEIHEARSEQLDATDKAAANIERRAAIESFDRSIKINESLQKQLMKGQP